MQSRNNIISFAILICIAFTPVVSGQKSQKKPIEKTPGTLELIRKSQIKQAEPAESMSVGRVLYFPEDRSLGQLMIQDSNLVRNIQTFYYWTTAWDPEWEYFTEAKGDVIVPAGKRLALTVNENGWKDLSCLSKLKPDDLYKLNVPGPYPSGPMPDDRIMPHIAHLTGLKCLIFGNTSISAKGLKHLADLKSLERLHIRRVHDRDLAEIAQLSWLKGLYLKEHRLRDKGITHIVQMKSLEELELTGGRLSDSSLAYIAKLPSLRYLMLSGDGFTDEGMAYIKDSPSLRILHFGFMKQLTDKALVHLSQMPRLERISLYWNENITDAGIVHLSKLNSLEMLNIGNSRVTDKGLFYLKDIKTLNYLSLPSKGISDTGLTYLGQMSNLIHLNISRVHYVDPTMDEGYYTDKGVAELARCKQLEELRIGSLGLTDEGMTHIVSLTNLKRLSLFGCPNVTNDGMAKLKNLKSLKDLSVYTTDMTVGGLSFLNELPNLTNLKLNDIHHDGSVMDISGLTDLQVLTLILHSHSEGDSFVSDSFKNEDWACLANLKKLKRLQITGIGIGDNGVKHLSSLRNLEFLNIICPGEERITDKALKYMTGMHELNRLYIKDGHFTDKALDYLDDMPSLTWLELTSDYAFSNQAIRDFQKKKPNLTKLQLMP